MVGAFERGSSLRLTDTSYLSKKKLVRKPNHSNSFESAMKLSLIRELLSLSLPVYSEFPAFF